MFNSTELIDNSLKLFNSISVNKTGIFPSTRYQGSKNKIVKWIDYCTKDLKFYSVI